MLLFYTVAIALTAAILVLGFQRLMIRQGRRAPLKATALSLTGATACALLSGFVLTNIAANNEAVQLRGGLGLGSIELASYPASGGEADPESPAGDIWAASSVLMAEPSILTDLGTGETVSLKTMSGKPATIRLVDAGQGEAAAVVTYDGTDLPVPGPFGSAAYNESGYPQLIPAPSLPARS